jgi:hypothetical protein
VRRARSRRACQILSDTVSPAIRHRSSSLVRVLGERLLRRSREVGRVYDRCPTADGQSADDSRRQRAGYAARTACETTRARINLRPDGHKTRMLPRASTPVFVR